jgi:hypothetical protein
MAGNRLSKTVGGAQQSGDPLIQANADGEPEKVLQW